MHNGLTRRAVSALITECEIDHLASVPLSSMHSISHHGDHRSRYHLAERTNFFRARVPSTIDTHRHLSAYIGFRK